jgi:hypothetical protein
VTGRCGRPLTARGLKAILTRAGVDHAALEIRDDPAIWTNVETGERGTSVVVSGPEEPRRQASRVLYDRGLACAPYSGRDEWSRPGGGIRVAGPARGGGPAVSEHGCGASGERARLHEMMTVNEAERTVADARMADLSEAQTAAWRRHRAAKGLVTRALKDGDAAKIAAAYERERQAYAEAQAVSDAGISEMFVINRAGLDRLGELNQQIDSTWTADAAQLDQMLGRDAEAGQ